MTAVFKYLAACVASIPIFMSCSDGGSKVRDILTNDFTEADLGKIKEKDGPVTFNLLVENTTGLPMVPLQTLTWCSCVDAEITDHTPVMPGETAKLSVTYNPAYRKGRFMEEIQLYYNDQHHLLSLIIKGEIIPYRHPVTEDHPYDYGNGMYLSHEVLNYGYKEEGGAGDMFIRVANEKKRKVELTFQTPEALEDHLSVNPLTLSGRQRDTLHLRFTMPEGYGPSDTLSVPIYPCVNGKPLPKPLIIKAIGL